MSVFTALIEFAFINFLDMFIRRLKHRSDLKQPYIKLECNNRDLVKVTTLTDMTRSMTAPLVHIRKLGIIASVSELGSP